MKLAFSIAKTHLLSRPKQTIVAMMGVTFGIGMFIAMVSLMTGLNDMTEDLAMTSSPDIRIYHASGFLSPKPIVPYLPPFVASAVYGTSAAVCGVVHFANRPTTRRCSRTATC